tara:strand:+ start:3931 stop:4308 length:378 start_codon:yes stop_codon:yes gene_type:complete
MESRKEKHERYLDKLERHISFANDSTKYSSDRFDILLISLSTSALILSIGFVDKVIPNLYCVNTSLLKTLWLLFVITLVSNLASQVTGYYSDGSYHGKSCSQDQLSLRNQCGTVWGSGSTYQKSK